MPTSSQITDSASDASIPEHPSTISKTSTAEILYNYPEDFPIPESGVNYAGVLVTILDRARGVLRAVINDAGAGDTTAIQAVEGMMIQGAKIACYLDDVKPSETKEV